MYALLKNTKPGYPGFGYLRIRVLRDADITGRAIGFGAIGAAGRGAGGGGNGATNGLTIGAETGESIAGAIFTGGFATGAGGGAGAKIGANAATFDGVGVVVTDCGVGSET